MPDSLLLLLQIASALLLALGLAVPSWRGRAAAGLAGLGVAALIAGLSGAGSVRNLDVLFRFAAFDAANYTLKTFIVDTVTADGARWGFVAGAWALAWAALLWLKRPDPAAGPQPVGSGLHPFWAPTLAAWSGVALMLLLEKTAAPAALVDPVPFDRVLLPASLAASAMLASRIRRVFPTFLWLAVFITVSRLPLAIWGTLATRQGLGTSLDVHTVTVFANPFQQIAVQVDPASSEQLAWLVWAPQLLVFPGLYLMSMSGIAFAIVMWVLHGEAARAQQAAQRQRHGHET